MKPTRSGVYLNLLDHSNKSFNQKKVVSYITILKKTSDECLQQKMRYLIFICLSRIIIKAINNFNFLTKQVPEYKKLHTNEEIATECYLVLYRCLENVDLSKVQGFYFYFNSGLNRAMYRIYNETYKKNFIFVDMNEDEEEFRFKNSGYNHNFDLTGIDLKDFTVMEWDIMKFKMSGNKLSDFLKEQNMSSQTFNESFENIKVKLQKTYAGEHFFANYATD